MGLRDALCVLLPILVAAVALLVTVRPWRRAGPSDVSPRPAGPRAALPPAVDSGPRPAEVPAQPGVPTSLGPGAWGGSAAAALGATAGLLAYEGLPRVPAVEAHDWLVPLALGSGLVGLAEVLAPTALRWVLRVALAVATPLALVAPIVRRDSGSGAAAAWVAGSAVAVLAALAVARRLGASRRGAGTPLVLMATASGAAVLSIAAGSARWGFLGGAFAATSGPVLVMSLWRRESATVVAAGPTLVTGAAALLLNACHFLDPALAPGVAAVALLAPLGALLADVPPVARSNALVRALVSSAGVLSPLGGAVAWAVAHGPAPSGY